IREVERQIGPLKERAETAAEHERLASRLRVAELSLLLDGRRRAKERFDEACRKSNRVNSERDGIRERLRAIEANVEERLRRVDQLDEEIERRRAMEERAKAAELEARHRSEMAKE